MDAGKKSHVLQGHCPRTEVNIIRVLMEGATTAATITTTTTTINTECESASMLSLYPQLHKWKQFIIVACMTYFPSCYCDMYCLQNIYFHFDVLL
jgi:hypothetical protein